MTSASPYPAGSPVSFRAVAAGCPNPIFQYWLYTPDRMWHLERPFSSDPTWTWNSSGLAPGTYIVDVWANQQGSYTGKQQAYVARQLVLTGCTTATLSPTSGSSRVGSSVTFSASARGCPKPVYKFWVRDPAGRWSVGRTWGPATWTWSTTGYARGAYRIVVWANEQNSSLSKLQAYDYSPYSLT